MQSILRILLNHCDISTPNLSGVGIFFVENLVTKIACGIAGFKVEEIGPLFADAIDMENIILPQEFVDEIQKL